MSSRPRCRAAAAGAPVNSGVRCLIPMKQHTALAEELEDKWLKEWNSGLGILSSIPSTSANCLVTYLQSLSESNRSTLFRALSKKGIHQVFGGLVDTALSAEEHTENNKAFHFAQRNAGMSLRMLKMLVGLKRTGNKLYDRYIVSPEMILKADNTVTCKASDLRKHIKQILVPEFRLSAQNDGGGDWTYRPSDSKKYWICIDFGGMDSQLRCDIMLLEPIPRRMISWEAFMGLVGICGNDWNLITEENGKEAVELLTRLLKEMISTFQTFELL